MGSIGFQELCQLAGGVVIFLYGLHLASENLKAVAGSRLKVIIKLLTANRWLGLCAGLLGTVLVQSNTATAVILVGLCQAGVITLTRSIGVLLGANLGSTVTVQVVAFDLYAYALLFIAAGYLSTLSIRGTSMRWLGIGLLITGLATLQSLVALASTLAIIGAIIAVLSFVDERRAAGRALMGLGFIFVGLRVIKIAMAVLKDSPAFSQVIIDFQAYPAAVIAAAFVFTVLTNSSTATLGTAIALVSAGGAQLIRPEGAVAIVMGAHLGSCPMALLSSTGAGRIARQVSFAHVFIKVAGVVVVFPVLAKFSGLLTNFNMWSGASPARAVANAHTLFNLVNVFTLILFTPQIATLLERLLPQQEKQIDGILKHIDEEQMEYRPMALDSVELELKRLAFLIRSQLREVPDCLEASSAKRLRQIQEIDDEVDALFSSILGFLSRMGQGRLGVESFQRVMTLVYVLTNLEGIGDRLSKDFHRAMKKRLDRDVQLSFEGLQQLKKIHEILLQTMDQIIAILGEGRYEDLDTIITFHDELMARTRTIKKAHFKQLVRGVHEAEKTSMIFLDTIGTMHDVHQCMVDIAENLRHCPYYGGKSLTPIEDSDDNSAAADITEDNSAVFDNSEDDSDKDAQ